MRRAILVGSVGRAAAASVWVVLACKYCGRRSSLVARCTSQEVNGFLVLAEWLLRAKLEIKEYMPVLRALRAASLADLANLWCKWRHQAVERMAAAFHAAGLPLPADYANARGRP